ncbi:hypothetical protein DVH26_14835 [Paenibacillus sp. H1-7]|uniref:hypothetical protein n=1 Tax=Paenibacillus sp. H1-7 TaxID=2282849 RepID=UPI001EF94767|nr:hypothetical protein [Paenibacillus sp. H1-7]ULL15606.1 hypothetical protein DVH26_14835 [Paenibacillus sp. H1-7]
MKLRLLPVLVSVVISASVLFGGWFAYQSYAMENPLESIVAKTPGVDLVNTRITNNEAIVELKLQPGTSLRETYAKIQNESTAFLGKKELKLKVVNDTTPEMEQWWSSALFDVAQAMETRHYAQIPTTLQSRVKNASDMKVATEMDDKFVFITLTDGDKSKYVMLPRTPEKMGVWPNE